MKVCKLLLVSAYDATSHRGWAEQLIQGCPEYAWTPLYGAARNFAWALRGRPLQWYLEPAASQLLQQDYAGMVVTSTVDLAALKAVFSGLRRVPTLLYMHENQFAYPFNPSEDATQNKRQRAHRIDACMVQLYALLAADRVVFNSEYNRESMREGIVNMLKKMPVSLDVAPIHRCLDSAKIVAVPVEDGRNKEGVPSREVQAPVILWNHRWEYDKAPERFLAALDRMAEEGLEFSLMLLGPNAQQKHAVVEKIVKRHAKRVLLHRSFADRGAYFAALQRADIAVSTALHDFQGVAMLEASLCGLYPVVPDRLAYREYYPACFRYPSFPTDPELECEALVQALKDAMAIKRCDLAGGRNPQETTRQQQARVQLCQFQAKVEGLRWSNLSGAYQELLRSLGPSSS